MPIMESVICVVCNIVQNGYLGKYRQYNEGSPQGSQPKNWLYYTKCKFYAIGGAEIGVYWTFGAFLRLLAVVGLFIPFMSYYN